LIQVLAKVRVSGEKGAVEIGSKQHGKSS
jgi:hypothetical protein